MIQIRDVGLAGLLLSTLFNSPIAQAGNFAIGVAPARFELQGKPGKVVRELLEIFNTDIYATTLSVRTADWDLQKDGSVKIHSEHLRSGSCRPWVRIERSEVKIPPKGKKRYRFELHIPADAQSGECRVALLVTGTEEPSQGSGSINIPVQGRIAVIVYLKVGDAQPDLHILGLKMGSVNQRSVPVLIFRNQGNAHGRPQGMLKAVDRTGTKLNLIVSPSPILPGETREIPLWLSDPADQQKAVIYELPMRVKGSVVWERGRQKIDVTIK